MKMDAKAKKRVAIARDVLKQLAARRIRPTHDGLYLKIGQEVADGLKEDQDLRRALRGKKCEVCAMGAMFMSHVDKFNGVTVADAGLGPDAYSLWADTTSTSSEVKAPLSAYFSWEQLSLIEVAYESPGGSTEAFRRYKSATGRLRAIMENIVANRGTFAP